MPGPGTGSRPRGRETLK